MIPATQIKVGNVILHDGKPCRVTNVLHVTPGNWRGMVHAKMVNLVTGSQVEYRFRSEDKVERADLDHHPLQYLYRSGDEFTFMNTENYEMVNVPRDHLGDAVNYLMDGMTVEMSYFEGRPVGVDVPMFVELEIIGCPECQAPAEEKAAAANGGRKKSGAKARSRSSKTESSTA